MVLKGGRLAYEPVFMFSHRQAARVSEFVTLRTVSGGEIQMSPSHYIWGSQTSRVSQGSAPDLWRTHGAEGEGSQDPEGREAKEIDGQLSDGVMSDVASSVTMSRRHMLSASERQAQVQTIGLPAGDFVA